jgi:hypothetical protein
MKGSLSRLGTGDVGEEMRPKSKSSLSRVTWSGVKERKKEER